jgi:hypothetical protein
MTLDDVEGLDIDDEDGSGGGGGGAGGYFGAGAGLMDDDEHGDDEHGHAPGPGGHGHGDGKEGAAPTGRRAWVKRAFGKSGGGKGRHRASVAAQRERDVLDQYGRPLHRLNDAPIHSLALRSQHLDLVAHGDVLILDSLQGDIYWYPCRLCISLRLPLLLLGLFALFAGLLLAEWLLRFAFALRLQVHRARVGRVPVAGADLLREPDGHGEGQDGRVRPAVRARRRAA